MAWLLGVAPAAAQESKTDAPTAEAAPGSEGRDSSEPSDAVGSSGASEATVQQARKAFRLGSALAEQGQYREALAAFERSAELLPHPATMYNIGYCERALGRYTRARKALRLARQQNRDATNGKLGEDLERTLDSYLAEADRKLAHISVLVSHADVEIAVDGRPLEVEPAPDASRPILVAGTREPAAGESPPAAAFDLLIDPGSHSFSLSRGGATKLVTHSFEPGATTSLRLDAPADRTAPIAPAPSRPVADAPPATPDRTWAYLAYSIGVAGITTGSVFGILALDRRSTLDDVCDSPGECPPENQGDIDTMNDYAMVSNIAFGVGIAGVAVGTVLLITEPSPTQKDTASGIEPWIGLGSAGMRGRF